MRYVQQKALHLNVTPDATPEEVKQWRQKDLLSRGDFDVMFWFVFIPSVIQFSTVGLMALIMFIIGVTT